MPQIFLLLLFFFYFPEVYWVNLEALAAAWQPQLGWPAPASQAAGTAGLCRGTPGPVGHNTAPAGPGNGTDGRPWEKSTHRVALRQGFLFGEAWGWGEPRQDFNFFVVDGTKLFKKRKTVPG